MRIGLSAGFIEPLESTGLALITIGANQLLLTLNGVGVTQYDITIYNAIIQNFFEETIDFITAHYTLNTRAEPFWFQARSQLKKSTRQLLYSKSIEDSVQLPVQVRAFYSIFGDHNWFTWLKQQ